MAQTLADFGPSDWLALAGIISTALVAVAGLIIQSAEARARCQHELVVSRATRMADWRRDTYVRLLQSLNTAFNAVARTFPQDDEPIEVPPGITEDEEGRLNAEVEAFGSQAVQDLLHQWSSEHRQFYVLARDIAEARRGGIDHSQIAADVRELREIRKRLVDGAAALRRQVSVDLSD